MAWSEILLQKARGIHGEIAALHLYLTQESGLTPTEAEARLEALCAGHYAMLDDLYLRQIPFAHAALTSDLFLNYRGPTAPIERAGLGAADRLFGTVRTEVGAMTRAILASQAVGEKETKAAGEIELTVSTYAPGSYVGFALPQKETESAGGIAMRQSLYNLGAVARSLPEKDPASHITTEIDDPQVRDATLGALKKLLPTRDKTIDAIELRGRALAITEPATLDRATWQIASHLMAQPIESTEKATFTGHLLQIDYELRRFELRRVDDSTVTHLRCAYSPALAAQCEALAKRKVEVRGPVALRQGRPRLLQVEVIREIE